MWSIYFPCLRIGLLFRIGVIILTIDESCWSIPSAANHHSGHYGVSFLRPLGSYLEKREALEMTGGARFLQPIHCSTFHYIGCSSSFSIDHHLPIFHYGWLGFGFSRLGISRWVRIPVFFSSRLRLRFTRFRLGCLAVQEPIGQCHNIGCNRCWHNVYSCL